MPRELTRICNPDNLSMTNLARLDRGAAQPPTNKIKQWPVHFEGASASDGNLPYVDPQPGTLVRFYLGREQKSG